MNLNNIKGLINAADQLSEIANQATTIQSLAFTLVPRHLDTDNYSHRNSERAKALRNAALIYLGDLITETKSAYLVHGRHISGSGELRTDYGAMITTISSYVERKIGLGKQVMHGSTEERITVTTEVGTSENDIRVNVLCDQHELLNLNPLYVDQEPIPGHMQLNDRDYFRAFSTFEAAMDWARKYVMTPESVHDLTGFGHPAIIEPWWYPKR